MMGSKWNTDDNDDTGDNSTRLQDKLPISAQIYVMALIELATSYVYLVYSLLQSYS